MEDGGREEPYAVFPTKPRYPLVVFLFVVVLFVFMLLFVLFFFVFLVGVESKGGGARSERQNEGNHDGLHSCVLSPNPNLVAASTAQESYRVQTGILEDRLSTIYCNNGAAGVEEGRTGERFEDQNARLNPRVEEC